MSKDEKIKATTIKWLEFHKTEIISNALAQEISEEDTRINNNLLHELDECIKWVKSK